MKKPVLCIVHQEHSIPGRVGHALQQLGYPLDIRRPRFGDPLPATMNEHSGAIVFGGPMSANDSDGFVRREIDWMAVPIAEDKPLLGICLGAQMLARQLGAKVFCHAQGHVEVGYYAIRPTEAGRALSPLWPRHVYQWHREGFDLADGAELLAEGECFPVQAFRYGSAFALQFHPEVTQAMMCRWTVRGAARLELPNARPREQHFADRAAYDYPVRQWLAEFLNHWVAGAAKTARAKAPSARTDPGPPEAAASLL
jgi:GMP synthase (glutamine-hydrolysing)